MLLSSWTAQIESVVSAVRVLQNEGVEHFLQQASEMLIACIEHGGKILVVGNGGSLCDAQHFAEELSGRYKRERRALPALALSDPGHLTCVGNDYGFDAVFARGVEALGQKGDVLVLLSTSGQSKNLVRALNMARSKEMRTVALLGKGGGALRGEADLEWVVPLTETARIQEVHMSTLHLIADRLDEHFSQ